MENENNSGREPDYLAPSNGPKDSERQRLYFVADSGGERRKRERLRVQPRQSRQAGIEVGRCSEAGELAYAKRYRGFNGRRSGEERHQRDEWNTPPIGSAILGESKGLRTVGSMEHAESEQVGLPGRARQRRETNGYWSDADWIDCADGKARPVERSIFALVDGTAERVVRSRHPSAPINANDTAEARTMRLRGYGNSLCAPVAQEFIAAYMEVQQLNYMEQL